MSRSKAERVGEIIWRAIRRDPDHALETAELFEASSSEIANAFRHVDCEQREERALEIAKLLHGKSSVEREWLLWRAESLVPELAEK